MPCYFLPFFFNRFFSVTAVLSWIDTGKFLGAVEPRQPKLLQVTLRSRLKELDDCHLSPVMTSSSLKLYGLLLRVGNDGGRAATPVDDQGLQAPVRTVNMSR